MTSLILGIKKSDYEVEVCIILKSHKKLWMNHDFTVWSIIYLWLEAHTSKLEGVHITNRMAEIP